MANKGTASRMVDNAKRTGFMSLMAVWGLVVTSSATPEIGDLKVSSVEPLGLAIDYTVSGAEAADASRLIEVSMSVGGATYFAKNLAGETNCVNGAHRIYWNMARDGLTIDTDAASVTVAYRPANVTKAALYCVIDLSKGPDAESYPVTYLDAPPPEGFSDRVYKKKMLVLKRVDPGSFIMGEDQSNEAHRVTLTKPFYLGIYAVTQRQWELVMGPNFVMGNYTVDFSYTNVKGDFNPAYGIGYNMIRGDKVGSEWPASNSVDDISFLGKLRDRTGIEFDLPTEAQWEYACRAGTTTRFSCGDTADGDYMWYEGNSSNTLHEVGIKKPNPWGFYDMHGNANEWCLDRSTEIRGNPDTEETGLKYGEDPVGATAAEGFEQGYRILRGGNCNASGECSSSWWTHGNPTMQWDGGFRLSRTLP